MAVKKREVGEFKARKVGTSLVITIPSELAVSAGEKFKLMVAGNGQTLTYERTTSDNPWDNGTFASVDFQQEVADVGNADDGDWGKEQVEWEN